MLRCLCALLLPCALLAACAPKPPPVPAAPPPVEAPVEEALPPPFTPEQIRAAMPTGTRLLIQRVDAAGAVTQEEWHVVDNTPQAARFAFVPVLEGQAQPEAATQEAVSWEELAAHAAFPASATTVEATSFETPLGMMEGWRYVQVVEVNGQLSRNIFEFSRAHPGPPLRMTVEVGGQPVARMEVLRIEAPAP